MPVCDASVVDQDGVSWPMGDYGQKGERGRGWAWWQMLDLSAEVWKRRARLASLALQDSSSGLAVRQGTYPHGLERVDEGCTRREQCHHFVTIRYICLAWQGTYTYFDLL